MQGYTVVGQGRSSSGWEVGQGWNRAESLLRMRGARGAGRRGRHRGGAAGEQERNGHLNLLSSKFFI